jgi:hypothetical protein
MRSNIEFSGVFMSPGLHNVLVSRATCSKNIKSGGLRQCSTGWKAAVKESGDVVSLNTEGEFFPVSLLASADSY